MSVTIAIKKEIEMNSTILMYILFSATIVVILGKAEKFSREEKENERYSEDSGNLRG